MLCNSVVSRKSCFQANTTVTFLCVVMRVGVNIIQFETFSMEWQQFNPSSVFDSLFTVCTKKNLLLCWCEFLDIFFRFHSNLERGQNFLEVYIIKFRGNLCNGSRADRPQRGETDVDKERVQAGRRYSQLRRTPLNVVFFKFTSLKRFWEI